MVANDAVHPQARYPCPHSATAEPQSVGQWLLCSQGRLDNNCSVLGDLDNCPGLLQQVADEPLVVETIFGEQDATSKW